MGSQRYKATRVDAISDGIFAIAMTLLILELKFPEVEGAVSRKQFIELCLGQLPHFVSWIISFSILSRLWIVHHELIESNSKKSQIFVIINFLFLGIVSFIPLPVSVINEHYEQPFSVFAFSLTYVFAGFLLAALWLVERRAEKPQGQEAIAPEEVRMHAALITAIWLTGIAICSFLLTLIDPKLGAGVWLIHPFIGTGLGKWLVRKIRSFS